jgi:hypothetical protein
MLHKCLSGQTPFQDLATASGLGWQLPPAAPIHVALAGRVDAEWHLDDDEITF